MIFHWNVSPKTVITELWGFPLARERNNSPEKCVSSNKFYWSSHLDTWPLAAPSYIALDLSEAHPSLQPLCRQKDAYLCWVLHRWLDQYYSHSPGHVHHGHFLIFPAQAVILEKPYLLLLTPPSAFPPPASHLFPSSLWSLFPPPSVQQLLYSPQFPSQHPRGLTGSWVALAHVPIFVIYSQHSRRLVSSINKRLPAAPKKAQRYSRLNRTQLLCLFFFLLN